MDFLTYFFSGLSLGSIYAIIALGYTMVYGIAKMLNFAHGDVLMVGAYITFVFMNQIGINPIISVVLSCIACTIIGVSIERIAYKPLRGANSLSVLITAIGVSYFLQNITLLIFGANTKSFKSIVNIPALHFFDGKLSITGESIVTILLCILIMIALTTFINKTKLGQAMLAVSEDRSASTLMGINVNGTIAMTFAIGSFLAAIAGVLLCSAYPTLTPTTGAMPGIKAFVAAVIGGIGSIPGAFIGGIILGVLENLSKAYISSQLSDAIVFSLLIIMLLVKPAGILGKANIEKV
ncbi:MAG: branched-chain amino acid ABC transporter permease [Lachnospiraceae bacterium]|nr:branched-chain amino acid ABC transporter permease [Lachnospiraceae bacterium]